MLSNFLFSKPKNVGNACEQRSLISIYSGYCSAMSCISRPKQPLGWGSPCHRLHMNSLRYSCYLLTIDQVSTDHRPSVDQLLTDTSVKYRRTIGEVSAKSRRSVGEVSVNEKLYRPRHIWNDYRSCLDRVSSDYRPSLDRLSTAISTESRPTIDAVSTYSRPLYRPIDRSTLPTINMIRLLLARPRREKWLTLFKPMKL